jgi:acyl-coenzyme A synthetase/AMP-(fatty) acid ligase
LLPHVDLRHPGEFDAPALLEHLARRQVTALAASPAFLDKLARTAATQHRSLPTVTRVFTGGAPVFPDLLDQAAQLAPHATICAVYGATEAEPIALLDRRSLSRDQRAALRAGMGLPAGQIVPGIEARVIEDRWGEPLGSLTGAVWDAWQLPPTQAGEIVVAGPHVLTTPTLGAPSPTQICVDDTIWHRTGDAGYFDHQGRLWLLGRCAARLAPKATDVRPRLYPLTVEAAAHAFPEVKHAALVDQRDRRILLLELYDRSLAAAVQQAVAGALRWANLDEVRVLARLPVDRRHNAKIDYPALRRLLEKSR